MLDFAEVPEPKINLHGFPHCKKCHTEVLKEGDLCGCHEGGVPPRDFETLRRTLLRQIRGSVASMQNCAKCFSVPMAAIRCPLCTWTRGAAMGLSGIAQIMGWNDDVHDLIDLIGIREEVPGTAKKEMGRFSQELH